MGVEKLCIKGTGALENRTHFTAKSSLILLEHDCGDNRVLEVNVIIYVIMKSYFYK